MRSLVHPALEQITVEGILHALSDPTRVEIFAKIAGSTCSANCSSFLTVGDRAVPKSTLSQHFKVLRDAGLVRSERVGVEMQNTSRCAEIETRFPGLLQAIVGALKTQSGERSVTRPNKKANSRLELGGLGNLDHDRLREHEPREKPARPGHAAHHQKESPDFMAGRSVPRTSRKPRS